MLAVVAVFALLALLALWASRMRVEVAGGGRRRLVVRREAFSPPAAAGTLVARVAGRDEDGEALLVCKPGASLRTTAGGVRSCCVARGPEGCGVCEFLGDDGRFEMHASPACPAGTKDAVRTTFA